MVDRLRFPLTTFLADLIRVQMGKATLADLRARWPEHRDAGVRQDWAAAYGKLMA